MGSVTTSEPRTSAGVTEPVNLGSGDGISIKEIAETIRNCYDETVGIDWDTSKPKGDALRIMDTTRAESYGFKCSTSIEDGVRETMNWFLENRDLYKKRNNYFTKD